MFIKQDQVEPFCEFMKSCYGCELEDSVFSDESKRGMLRGRLLALKGKYGPVEVFLADKELLNKIEAEFWGFLGTKTLADTFEEDVAKERMNKNLTDLFEED